MFQALDHTDKLLLLGAIKAVAVCGNAASKALDALSRENLRAIYQHLLEGKKELDMDFPLASPQQIKQLLSGHKERDYLLSILTVCPFIHGILDLIKIDKVIEFANGLEVTAPFLDELELVKKGKLKAALEDMTIQNYDSLFGGQPSYEEVRAFFMPYEHGKANAKLAKRYHDLVHYPPNSLGYAFWEQYAKNHYKFPGEEGALVEAFGVPHDSTHILSGYKTDARGEILVSTFTAMMHKKLPLTGHVLPVLFTWHLGIDVNGIVRTNTNKLDISAFWLAWRRGEKMEVDIFSSTWDFLKHAERSVSSLQEEYNLHMDFT